MKIFLILRRKEEIMYSACDIVYDLPSEDPFSKLKKTSMCNIVICLLLVLVLYNTLNPPYILTNSNIPQMVSSMASSIINSEFPTSDETSASNNVSSLPKKDLALSADSKNSKADPESYKSQTQSEKNELTERVGNFVKSENVVIAMFWAPWCSHCHNAMKPFNEASQKCPNTKFLMVNCEAVNKDMLNSKITNIPHFPFICRFEKGKMKKVFESAPTAEQIANDLVPEESSSTDTAEVLDQLFQ